MIEIKGYCFLYSETGTEGGWWAVQEDGFKLPSGYESYYGLNYLEEGDRFTVYNEDGTVRWSGVIHKNTEIGKQMHSVFRDGKWVKDPEWTQQVVDNMWVHWVQDGINPEEWGKLFLKRPRCLLEKPETPRNLETRKQCIEGYEKEV